MAEIKAGAHVKFLRQHDKNVELSGTVTQVNEDGTLVIETVPDGKIAEVSTIETAHLDDVTLIEDEDETAEAENPLEG